MTEPLRLFEITVQYPAGGTYTFQLYVHNIMLHLDTLEHAQLVITSCKEVNREKGLRIMDKTQLLLEIDRTKQNIRAVEAKMYHSITHEDASNVGLDEAHDRAIRYLWTLIDALDVIEHEGE